MRIEGIRTKLAKVVAKVIIHAHKITIKLCSTILLKIYF